MEKTNSMMKKHPIWFGAAATALFVLVIVLTSLLLVWAAPGINDRMSALIQSVAVLVYTVILLRYTGMSFVLREKGKGFFRGCLVGLYLMIASVYSIIVQLLVVGDAYPMQSFGMIVLFMVDMALIGITEEVVFRGVIMKNMQTYFGDSRAGIWKAVIASSLLFGCAHITNIVGMTAHDFLSRILFTICTGMILAAIYIRCNNIWVVAFIHALIDFSSEILDGLYIIQPIEEQVTASADWSFLLEDIVYFCVVLFLLRKKKLAKQ